MNKKDKIMIGLSVIFLILAATFLVFGGGSGKIKKVFADWDDGVSDSDSKEFSEDWVATEVTGSAEGLAGIRYDLTRMYETTSIDSPAAGQKIRYTTWVAKGYENELVQYGLANKAGFQSSIIGDPIFGQIYSLDWQANSGNGRAHLNPQQQMEVTKWRVYGHIHP